MPSFSSFRIWTLAEQKIFLPSFFKNVKQLKLCSCQLGFYVIQFTHNTDIYVGVWAGKYEKLSAEKDRLTDNEIVRLGADDTRYGKSDLFVVGVYHCKLAFPAVAFKLDHICRKGEQSYSAEYAGSTMGASVCHYRLFSL